MSKRSRLDEFGDRFGKRIGAGARTLPEKSHGWFRRWFRKVWDVRGGGLYACGFAATFIFLELGSIVEDVKGIGVLLDGQFINFAVDFFVDSFKNTIQALMWPAMAVQFAMPWGAIGLGLAFAMFPKYVKPTIERWLFADDGASDTEADD